MGWLVALGLLAAFSAALLSHYGRRLLAVMALVGVLAVCGLLTLGYMQGHRAEAAQAQ